MIVEGEVLGFKNKALARLEKEIKDKEREIRNNTRSEKEEDRNKSIFKYRATDGKRFDFNDEKNFLNFAEDLYKRNLTFDEAEKEQEKIFEAINELEKRINPRTGSGPKEDNKKKEKS